MHWWRLAAGQDYAPAEYDLVLCYHYGKGVDRNPEESREWFQKAAELGYAGAQFALGVYHYHKYIESKVEMQSPSTVIRGRAPCLLGACSRYRCCSLPTCTVSLRLCRREGTHFKQYFISSNMC